VLEQPFARQDLDIGRGYAASVGPILRRVGHVCLVGLECGQPRRGG
jgi:hypothetical protein